MIGYAFLAVLGLALPVGRAYLMVTRQRRRDARRNAQQMDRLMK